jgi:hypothetical protein
MCLNPKYAIKESGGKWRWSTLQQDRYKIRFIDKDEYYKNRDNPNIVKIPCRKCEQCRAIHAQEWGARAWLETIHNKKGIFLTLSYNDKNLPRTKSGIPTLKKEDVTKFKKRLRKKYGELRTFECGEYGERKGRPHYHMIIWNIDIADRRIVKENEIGDTLYTSETLTKIWNKGIIIFGNITYESAAYTARYTSKKFNTKWDRNPEQENTYINMSRRPGLGQKEWEKNQKKYKELNAIYIPTRKGAKITRLPRYYTKKWEAELRNKEVEERKNMLTQEIKEANKYYKKLQEETLEIFRKFMKDENNDWQQIEKIRTERKKIIDRYGKYLDRKYKKATEPIREATYTWKKQWENTPIYINAEIERANRKIQEQAKLEKTDITPEDYDNLIARTATERLMRLAKIRLDK